ncbi:MAG: metallophosphoesterase [Bacillus sp. (in: Bacteria)]|nr:metallophosphoesterase [Bacillus sp. (in: firmicutes)]
MNEFQTGEKPVTRRSFLKKGGKMTFGLMATGLLMGTYSFEAERFWYQINEVHLKVKNLPAAFEGWKIVQFSDIHLGFHYGVEDFQAVVKTINDVNPDIIFFTGDLIEAGNKEPELSIPLLQALKANRGGKWAVVGNHDYSDIFQVVRVLEQSQFQVLLNNHHFIESNHQRLYIAGIDDVMYGRPNIGQAVTGLSDDDCVLFLAHEPDIADESCLHPIGVQFSGHSHGGQVRIPFYGPIIKQKHARKYEDGLYQVGESKMPLYVNRGIGTTNIAIRFFCRPEITVFHLTL